MNAYSENLRKNIVEALRRGRTNSEAARLFKVSGQVYVRPRTQLLARVSLIVEHRAGLQQQRGVAGGFVVGKSILLLASCNLPVTKLPSGLRNVPSDHRRSGATRTSEKTFLLGGWVNRGPGHRSPRVT